MCVFALMHKMVLMALAFAMLFAPSCKKKNSNTPVVSKEKILKISTAFGDMYLWLYKQTPLHRDNYLKLAGANYFDSITFHRVVQDFVIQGGDPNTLDQDTTNDGYGGPGYTIPAEFVDTLTHNFGAVGAARDNNPQKASNGSQFYIVVDKNGEHTLDKNYTVFGKVISGMDAAVTISKQPKNKNNRPYQNIRMNVDVVEYTLEELWQKFGFRP